MCEKCFYTLFILIFLIRVRRKNVFIVLNNFTIFSIALYVYLFVYSVFRMLDFSLSQEQNGWLLRSFNIRFYRPAFSERFFITFFSKADQKAFSSVKLNLRSRITNAKILRLGISFSRRFYRPAFWTFFHHLFVESRSEGFFISQTKST